MNRSNLALRSTLIVGIMFFCRFICIGQLSVSIQAQNNFICPGGSTIINSFVSGNFGPVTYSWQTPIGFSGNESNPSIVADVPGTYTLVISDGFILEISESETIFEIDFSVTIDPPGGSYCAKTSGLELTAMSSALTENFVWSVPAGFLGNTNAPTINANVPGIYSVSNEQAGCTIQSKSVTVSEVNLGLNLAKDDPSTVGGSDGNIFVTVNGGSPPYDYTYSGIGTGSGSGTSSVPSFTIDNLEAGNYQVNVTDGTGCNASQSIALIAPACEIDFSATPSSPTCFGGDDGSIAIRIDNGIPPFSIFWSGPSTSGISTNSQNYIVTNLSAGVYSVNVTDNAGCSVEKNVTVINPSPLTVNINGDLVYCEEAGGTLLSTSPGGFNSYLWSNGTSGSTAVVTGSGNYSVTVTDNDGCTASSSVAVTELEPITISFVNGSSNLQESCAGLCDGALTVNVSGGSEIGVSYSWTGPGGYSSVNQNISNLCPGTYTLTVIDSEGCTATFTRTILVGDNLVLNLSSQGPTCAGSSDGFIILNFSGGSNPYSVAWSGAESGGTSNISNGHTISDLVSGNYNVTLTDANGCTASQSATLTLPGEITFTASELSPSCAGSNTGSIFVDDISNGSLPYTVLWTIGGVTESATTSGNSYTIEFLIAGTYTIQIEDANGCGSDKVTVIVSEENSINVDIVGDVILCADQVTGILSTNPSGFSDYKWSNGATTASISISATGNYSVTVTDGGGCMGSTSVQVIRSTDINISTINSSSNLVVSCEGDCDGMITPKVDGGQGPYTYNWSGPSGYSSTSQVIDNLCAGVYTLDVEDSNGCFATFTQQISEASSFGVSLDATPSSCAGENDGAIESKVEGGAPPYTYLWSNGSNMPDVVDLSPGLYTLTVTDSKGCTSTSSATVGELSGVNGTLSPQNSRICNGESITLQAGGGASYLWSTGSTSSSISVSPSTTTNYTVTITGSSGKCSDVRTAIVQVSDLVNAEIVVTENSGLLNNDGEICFGSSVNLFASGGENYSWEGGFPNPFTVTLTENRSFKVTITDDFGCSTILTEDIVVNENPTAIIDLESLTNIVGVTQLIGNSSIANCGSVSNCSWEIDDVEISSSCEDVEHIFEEAGESTIQLTVENSCGCVDHLEQIVPIAGENDCRLFFNADDGNTGCVGSPLNLNIEFIPQTGCELEESSIKVFKEGTSFSNYEISGNSIIFLEAGIYEVEATFRDNCSCLSTTRRELTVLPRPSAEFAAENVKKICEGSIVEFFISDFDQGERVTILFNGQENTYESNSFELFFEEPGLQVIQMISVSNGICTKELVNETLELEVFENLEIVSTTFECNDANGTYNLIVTTAGGDPSSGINVAYDDAISIGDAVSFFNLDPQIQYEFSLQRGLNCEPITFIQDPVPCNCSSNSAILDEDSYFVGCSGSFFNIQDLEVTNDNINSLFDTLVYILHDGEIEGELGEVFAVYPRQQISITNDFPNYTPNKRYELSLVSFRKLTFLDYLEEGIEGLSFLSIVDCASVSNSVPLIWHGSNVSITGPSQVCENAYNEIFVSSGIGDGAEISIDIPGLTEENYSFVPSDGRLYVHFVSGTAQDVPISIFSKTSHQVVVRGDTVATTCESDVTYDVTIDKANEAPDTSKVILWPGWIFASTDTTENICHRWGKTSRISISETIDTLFEGANDRFFYADEDDVISLNENRQIWVETFFCDDPVCFTRNIYNGRFPINADIGIAREDISIFPNPSEGLFTLKISNAYKGKVEVGTFDIHGRQIGRNLYAKNGNVMSKLVDLRREPNGVYIISVVNEGGERLIYKVIKQQE